MIFKKTVMSVLGLLFTLNVQALDKTQVDLENSFWGNWSVNNAKTQCTESYQFIKPGQFTYAINQKKMTGEFVILRSQDVNTLDILKMKVKTDNQKVGCGGQSVDYSNADIILSLKWLSAKTAELCTDQAGKQCTGLYLIKQK